MHIVDEYIVKRHFDFYLTERGLRGVKAAPTFVPKSEQAAYR